MWAASACHKAGYYHGYGCVGDGGVIGEGLDKNLVYYVVVVVVVIQKVAPGVTAQAYLVTYQSLSLVGTVYARLYIYIKI